MEQRLAHGGAEFRALVAVLALSAFVLVLGFVAMLYDVFGNETAMLEAGCKRMGETSAGVAYGPPDARGWVCPVRKERP